MTEKTDTQKLRKQRRGAQGPTVADVARTAGVSPMTVSRVVNNDSKVLDSTKEKVEAAIKLLGYVPNLAARSLAGGRQCRIALLHSNPSAAYLSEFLVGSLAEATIESAQIVVEHCAHGESPQDLVARITSHRVDAVLLPPPLSDDSALLDALHKAGLPLAQVATGKPADFANAVIINDEEAAYVLTTRLAGLGHERIGFIGGNPNQTASLLRHQGYRRALKDAGLSTNTNWEVDGDFTFLSGLAGAEILLKHENRPTAIFACNDDMAVATIATAHRMGLEVPRDLAVCGFDDTASATMVWPELTTVRQPVADMARLAVRLLVNAVTSENAELVKPRHEQLNFTLVIRDSDSL